MKKFLNTESAFKKVQTMKNIIILSISLLLILLTNGCEKQAPVDETEGQAQVGKVPKASGILQKEESAKKVAIEAEPEQADPSRVSIPLELPMPMFIGTPENLSGIKNLEKPLGKPRPLFYAPQGTQNIALNKPVTGSEEEPIIGDLEMIVDGDKEASDGNIVELGPFKQWVQIDLEQEYNIYAIVFWHFHKTPRVYLDVAVQVSNDPDFIMEVTTVFNSDAVNSLGLGVGSDMHYVETAEGKLVDARGVQGRYVRLYSQGNNQNDLSHYIEVEVYGK